MPIVHLNRSPNKEVMVSRINRRKGEKRDFKFAEARQRLGNFGLQVCLGEEAETKKNSLPFSKAKDSSPRRRASGLNINVTFCPFSPDNFKPKTKQDQN